MINSAPKKIWEISGTATWECRCGNVTSEFNIIDIRWRDTNTVVNGQIQRFTVFSVHQYSFFLVCFNIKNIFLLIFLLRQDSQFIDCIFRVGECSNTELIGLKNKFCYDFPPILKHAERRYKYKFYGCFQHSHHVMGKAASHAITIM